MNNPLVHAFFVGRAFAEALSEQVEQSFTNTMSELGKFDAEQRERLRQFTELVLEKARRDEEAAIRDGGVSSSAAYPTKGEDLQTMIDELRAEIAQLRSELQSYRSRSV